MNEDVYLGKQTLTQHFEEIDDEGVKVIAACPTLHIKRMFLRLKTKKRGKQPHNQVGSGSQHSPLGPPYHPPPRIM